MKFGLISLDEAEGATLAHAVRVDGLAVKKGDTLTPERRRALGRRRSRSGRRGAARGRRRRRERGRDAPRDATCGRACPLAPRPSPAASICSPKRRAWLSSTPQSIDRLNAIDEALTVATLPRFRSVAEGDMVATVKIIPFATQGEKLAAAFAELARPAVSVAPYRPLRVAVVSTLLPGLKASVVAKTLRVLEARLAPTGARVVAHETTPARDRCARRAARPSRRRRGPADRVRRLGDHRPAGRDPGGDRGDRRAHRAFRHAGRSGQPPAARLTRRHDDHRRSRLRALAEREWLRLGSPARHRRGARVRGPTFGRWASAGC